MNSFNVVSAGSSASSDCTDLLDSTLHFFLVVSVGRYLILRNERSPNQNPPKRNQNQNQKLNPYQMTNQHQLLMEWTYVHLLCIIYLLFSSLSIHVRMHICQLYIQPTLLSLPSLYMCGSIVLWTQLDLIQLL